MVRAPGSRPPSRRTTHRRATRDVEVAGGWLVPPDNDRHPAARPIGGLPFCGGSRGMVRAPGSRPPSRRTTHRRATRPVAAASGQMPAKTFWELDDSRSRSLDYTCSHMNTPELTDAQHEIVSLLWATSQPMTIAEIWGRLREDRKIARTTVQTWVNRLERRGWLVREETPRGLAFRAIRAPNEATVSMAARFLESFFGGSPTRLVSALAGRGQLDREEVERLRRLLDELEESNAESA